MNGQRLRQLRLARGLSLDALAAALGGIVTKQSLSKYEQGKVQPSVMVLGKLASTLGVKAASLCGEPSLAVEFIAYRKASGLLRRDQETVESCVRIFLEERVRLQERIHPSAGMDLLIQDVIIDSIEEVEVCATRLRGKWNLGLDPISSVTSVLEQHRVHVIEIDAPGKFDGISAFASDGEGRVAAAAVVTRRGLSGERQRLNLAHELGHLIMNLPPTVDAERAAFRFAGAFLAPADTIFEEIGKKRAFIGPAELRLLKRQFGMSMQALLFRLKDLAVIGNVHYREWCIQINRLGWRKAEPDPLPPEEPQWLRQNVLRGFSEGLISQEEAERLVNEKIVAQPSLSLVERRALLKLPLEVRNRVLAEQSAKMAAYYEHSGDWKDWLQGDLVE